MSKKAIAVDEAEETETPKSDKSDIKPVRKRSKCCTCCLVALIVVVIILAAAFGVGWYFGDRFTKAELGMSLKDTFGVASDLYWTKDKDVVTNPFDDSDLDGFYAQIKANMLLKTDADIDFDAALEKALTSMASGGSDDGDGAAFARALSRNSDGGDKNKPDGTGETDADGGGSSIMDAFVDMVAEVFTRDNIDIERLSDYAPEHDTYVFELRDRQLAAFMNAVIKLMLENGGIAALEQYSEMVDLKNVVALKQIRFKAVPAANELGENVMTATTADVTVWVGLQDAAGQAITHYASANGFGWASGLARWLGNVFLPKNLYATITIPLHGEAPTQVTLNDMSERERERAYALVNGILAMTSGKNADSADAPTTVQSLLDGITEKLSPYLETAAGSMDFAESASGAVKLDLIGALADVASKDMADPLAKSDFMYMLQALLTSDADARRAQLRPYLYDKWYKDGAGALEYDPADKTGKTRVDYEREFIAEIESKYAVDFGENASLSDVFKMLGVDLGGTGEGEDGASTDDVINRLDAERLHAAFDKPTEQLKLRITDRMLAAALSTQMDALLSKSGGVPANLKISLDALTFVKRKDSAHTFALVAAEADVAAMLGDLGGNAMLGKLAANIVPEKLLLSITVDVTQSLGAGESYEPTEFMLNDYENTDRVIATLSKLVPALDLASVSDSLGESLRDMIRTLDETLHGIVLVSSVTTETETTGGELILPDIFTVITDTVLTDDNGDALVSADELKSVLRALDNSDGVEGKDGEIAPDYSQFIDGVVDMYYLNPPAPITTFDGLTDFLADGEGENAFDASKFRVNDKQPDSLAYDKRAAAELRPLMSCAELGALIKSNMGDNESVKDYELTDVRIVARGDGDILDLVIVMAANVATLMPGDMHKLLTAEKIYVTVTVEDVNNPVNETYPVSMRVNAMDDGTYENMLAIARHFGADFDMEAQTAEFGNILYEQIRSLETSVGEGFISFTPDGLQLESFYSFLARKLDLDKADDGTTVEVNPEHVKEATQGLYALDADAEPDNGYNYVYDEFVRNPSEFTTYDGYAELFNPLGGATTDTDKEFNGFFQQAMRAGGMGDSVLAVQTTVLAEATGGESAAAKTIRDWANGRIAGAPVTADKDFVLVTFRLSVTKDEQNGDASDGFMPDYIYVTVAMEKVREGGKDRFEDRGQIFNDMSADARKHLLKMMNMSDETTDDGKINIHSVVMQCLTALNGKDNGDGTRVPGVVDMRDISFGATADATSGIGTITFAKKSI